MPRVAHVCRGSGGFANSTRRVHLELRRQEFDSHLFITPPYDHCSLEAAIHPLTTSPWLDRRLARRGVDNITNISSMLWDFSGFDIIHLHGIEQSWFNLYKLLPLDHHHQLVLTLHMKNIGTGGCAGPEMWACDRWRQGCGQCPMAAAEHWWWDGTGFTFNRRKNILNDVDLTLIALNQWMVQFAQESEILKKHPVVQIPNGIDTDFFRPLDKSKCREAFGLPLDKKLILTVSPSFPGTRRQFHLYSQILGMFREHYTGQDVALVLVGGGLRSVEHIVREIETLLPVYQFKTIDNETELIQLYNCADVYMYRSMVDNQPNVILEAMACGLPIVGTGVGGVPEMISSGEGILVPLYDLSQMSKALADLLSDDAKRKSTGVRARDRIVKSFGVQEQAQKYIELYERIGSSEIVLF